jgi:inosine/guanosine/xanthosine phosphorylase family protein
MSADPLGRFVPRLGIILGSGLAEVADAIEAAAVVDYEDLPGFPRTGVAGHRGRLVLGTLAGLPVACLQGRAHVYEGVDAASLATPVRTLRRAGAELLLVTNAAGSLRPEVGPGRLMLISDHINLLGVNPLTGPNDDAVGPRFPGLRDAYDPALRGALRDAARAESVDLAEGVYLATPGPSFETPAEIRAFRTLGADAVGMSTVPEVIAARHCGLRVAALSVITNLAEGLGDEPLSHAQTLAFATAAAGDLRRVVMRFCGALATEGLVPAP